MLPIIILGIAVAVCAIGCATKTEDVTAKSPEKKPANKEGAERTEQADQTEPPKPVEVDKEDEALKAKCPELSGPLGAGDFFVREFSTADPNKGYSASITVGSEEKAKGIYLGPFKEMGSGNNFPYKEGQENYSMAVEGLSEGCNSWQLDKSSHKKVVSKLDAFIEEKAATFLSLRDKAKLIRVADVPYNNQTLNWIIMALDRPMLVDNISKTKSFDQAKGKLARNLFSFKKYFADVGMEYVTDPNGVTYVAIYGNVNDKKEGKQPLFFVVDPKRTQGSKIEPLLFIHNFNEDTERYYLAPNGTSGSTSGSTGSTSTSTKAEYERCDKEVSEAKYNQACRSMVDLCMATSDAAARITLNTDSGPITLNNKEFCLNGAIWLSRLHYELK